METDILRDVRKLLQVCLLFSFCERGKPLRILSTEIDNKGSLTLTFITPLT